MEKLKGKRWLSITIYVVILVGLSIALSYGIQRLMANSDISIEGLAPLAYAVVFGVTLICNATIIVPVPIAAAVMIAAASEWDPIMVAFVASIAGALGEMTGYYAGYLGKKIAISESAVVYRKFAGWMSRYGPLAIFFISLQPILPFDIAGLIAGASRIPLWKFLLACWAGKFPKYILFSYFGLGLPNLFSL